MRRFVSCAVVLCFGAAVLAAQPDFAPRASSAQASLTPNLIALINASVVNVRTGAIQRNATVVLRNGVIESVGTAAVPAGARTIDLRNRYVVPGLIDAHVHISSLPQLRAAL
jgi:imidazolonepropionase-like amidohydrolase